MVSVCEGDTKSNKYYHKGRYKQMRDKLQSVNFVLCYKISQLKELDYKRQHALTTFWSEFKNRNESNVGAF